MARGMPPRPASGAGRPPPARQQPPRQRTAEQQRRAGEQQRQRAAEQQRRAAERQRQRAVDQHRRGQQERRTAATRANQHRLRQQQYLREALEIQGEAEAARRTDQVHERVAQLESILLTGLRRPARIDLEALSGPAEPAFDPGPLATPAPEPNWEDFAPGGMSARWPGRPGRQHRNALAQQAYQQAREDWERAEQERAERLAEVEQAHEQRLAQHRADAAAYRSRIARVAAGLRERDPAVVESYLRTVLRRMPLPAGFPRRAEVSHDPEREWVTLRMVLPDGDIVPEAAGYEYLAPANEVRPVPWPEEAAGDLYYRVVAQVSLLSVRDLLAAEPGLAGASFHGLVDDPGPDPDTGGPVLAGLVSFHPTRDEFTELDLAQLAPEECLDRLGARVSSDPSGHDPAAAAGAGPAP